MKKTIPLFLMLAILSGHAFSQTKTKQKTDKEIEALICHNWQLIKTETNGKTYPLPADKKSSLLIQADGTVIEKDQDKEYPGKWKLSHRVMSITNNDKGPVETYKIIKVTSSDLIYETNEDGTRTKMILMRID